MLEINFNAQLFSHVFKNVRPWQTDQPLLFHQKSCCSYWFSTLWGEFCVSYQHVLLSSLVKCALNQHISTKTRALFKLNQTRCQNFAGLHSFLHGGSDKQPVFVAVGQTSDFFPFLSWQMIPNGMLSYTVNMKVRQHWCKVCCLTCLMNE